MRAEMAKFGGHRRLLEDAPVPRWWEEDDRRGDDEIAMVLSITPMLTLLVEGRIPAWNPVGELGLRHRLNTAASRGGPASVDVERERSDQRAPE